jgi:glycosyltransferase involved in cell wall biosynthesis
MTLDIMLPFYGRFDHFRTAVESVLAQDDPDWTLTIVDDRYPDTAPGEWAAALGDPRIHYLRNDVNLGVSKNYLKCVSLMTSKFSVIFGCDDVMLPGYVGRVRQLIERYPTVDVIQPGVEVIDENGKQYLPLVDRMKNSYRFSGSGSRLYAGEKMAVSLLRGNWTYFPSLVWRVDMLRKHGFHDELDVVQDFIMLLDIIADGGSFALDDVVVFHYRRHVGSVSSSMAADGSRFAQERRVFDEQAARFGRLGWPRAVRAARWHVSSKLNALTRLPAAVRHGNGRSVRALLAHAVGLHIREP